MTEKRKRRTSNPRTEYIGIRVTKDEKEEINNIADHLELTLTDTLIEGAKALDEKYRLIKNIKKDLTNV